MSHLWTCLRPLSWCLWGLLCMSCGTRTWRLWYRAWTKKLVQPFIFPITSGCAPDVVPVVARAFCFKLGADYCKPVGWPDGSSAHMFWYIVNEVRKDLEAKGFVGKEIKANLCCRGGRGGWVLVGAEGQPCCWEGGNGGHRQKKKGAACLSTLHCAFYSSWANFHLGDAGSVSLFSVELIWHKTEWECDLVCVSEKQIPCEEWGGALQIQTGSCRTTFPHVSFWKRIKWIPEGHGHLDLVWKCWHHWFDSIRGKNWEWVESGA